MVDDVRRCTCGAALPTGRLGSWCSSWCQARDEQGLPPEQPPPRVARPHELRGRPLSVEDAVRRRLGDAGLLESWQAVQALDMARWIDAGTSKGSALAALHRELRSTMADALRGVDEADSPVKRYGDELEARRRRRGAS